MKKLAIIGAALGLLVTLVGCGQTLGKRVEIKKQCDEAGGTYSDRVSTNGVGLEFFEGQSFLGKVS